MSIEKVKAYFAALGMEDRVLEFPVSSATVELAAAALGCEPCRIAKTLSFVSAEGAILILASGLAALIGGRIFGPMADKSSKRLMTLGAGVASSVVILIVAVAAIPDFLQHGAVANLVFIVVYLALTLMHTGIRVGRKTYLVDMAEGDQRTTYVAVSNTVLGIVLLIVGGISSLLAMLHIFAALLFLSATGLAGVVVSARLPEVSAEPSKN